jgi:prolyl-tRNA synthetase
MNMAKSEIVSKTVNELYETLKKAGLDVLLDDRPIRPGVMFADMELIGIPHRIVIGEKSLANGMLEYKGRTDKDKTEIALENIVTFITEKINGELNLSKA